MAGDAIRVGASLDLSGRFALQGQQAAQGLRLWAEQANAAGGLATARGRRAVALTLLDDRGRAEVARACYAELIEPGRVELLLGPYGSHLVLAVAPLAEAAGLVLWNHGGSTDVLDRAGLRSLVSLPSPAGQYFYGTLELAAAQAPAARRLALLHAAVGSFGAAVAGGALTHAQSLGFLPLVRDVYPGQSAEYDALAETVAGAAPDVVLGAGSFAADVAFARALRRAGVHAGVIGLVAAGVTALGATLGADADGILGPSQWEPGLRLACDAASHLGPSPFAFARAYRARYGEAPDYPAAQAFAAGVIAQRCLEQVGMLDQAALRAAADTLDLTTCYGHFRLDPRSGRQVGHELLQVQWQAGQKRIVWPAHLAEARPIPSRPAG